MKQLFLSFTKVLSVSLIFSSVAIASGGYSSGSSGGYSSPTSRPVNRVDQDYELGKSIFQGRQAGVAKLSYCVEVDGEQTEVKKSSIKQFKRQSYSALANGLFDCDQPGTLVASHLDTDSLISVVYYLGKRYRLNLSGS